MHWRLTSGSVKTRGRFVFGIELMSENPKDSSSLAFLLICRVSLMAGFTPGQVSVQGIPAPVKDPVR